MSAAKGAVLYERSDDHLISTPFMSSDLIQPEAGTPCNRAMRRDSERRIYRMRARVRLAEPSSTCQRFWVR